MRRALDEYQVRGIETNLAFHRRCLRQEHFVAGDYDTGFIGRNAAELTPRADGLELDAALIAAALDTVTRAGAPVPAASATNGAAHHAAPTTEISGWRRSL
jgi:acetyl/propionyl-CoA carboxylase alpha subunit